MAIVYYAFYKSAVACRGLTRLESDSGEPAFRDITELRSLPHHAKMESMECGIGYTRGKL